MKTCMIPPCLLSRIETLSTTHFLAFPRLHMRFFTMIPPCYLPGLPFTGSTFAGQHFFGRWVLPTSVEALLEYHGERDGGEFTGGQPA